MTTRRRAPKRPLHTISLGGLLDRQFSERQHLVAPWLRQGESAMLWAGSGQGKTMLALSLALAAAGGGSLLGWNSPKPRTVLYVDGEMHIQDLRDRLRVLAGTVDGCDLEAARRNLTVLSRQDQDAGTYFPDLAQPDGRERILEEAAKCQAELIVLDNFSTLADSLGDENEAAAMSPVLGFLLQLKQAGHACILVHHANKAGENYRGSSKLATTFEVILGLKPVHGHRAPQGTAFTLEWTKYRGTPDRSTRAFEAALTETETGRKWASTTAVSEEIAVMIEALESCRFTTQDALAAELGWDKTKVSKTKAKAIAANAITRDQFEGWLTAAQEAEGGPFGGLSRDF